MARTLSARGAALIADHEGKVNTLYDDPATSVALSSVPTSRSSASPTPADRSPSTSAAEAGPVAATASPSGGPRRAGRQCRSVPPGRLPRRERRRSGRRLNFEQVRHLDSDHFTGGEVEAELVAVLGDQVGAAGEEAAERVAQFDVEGGGGCCVRHAVTVDRGCSTSQYPGYTLGTMKTCNTCGQEKAAEQFYRYKSGRLHTNCYPCHNELAKRWYSQHPLVKRNADLRRKYGIGIEEYADLLEKQGGTCALCQQVETVSIRGKVLPLAVDHDHASGRVRGLLCAQCNLTLGTAERLGLARLQEYLG